MGGSPDCSDSPGGRGDRIVSLRDNDSRLKANSLINFLKAYYQGRTGDKSYREYAVSGSPHLSLSFSALPSTAPKSS